jgi:hypothetical protein
MEYFEYVNEFGKSLVTIKFDPKRVNSLKRKSKKNFILWFLELQKKIQQKLPSTEITVSYISGRITLFHNGQRINGWDLYCLYRTNYVVYKAKKDDTKVQNWISSHKYVNLIIKILINRPNDYRNNIKETCPLVCHIRELLLYYGISDEEPKHITERNECAACKNWEELIYCQEENEYKEQCIKAQLNLAKEWGGRRGLSKDFSRILRMKKEELLYNMYPQLKCTCS